MRVESLKIEKFRNFESLDLQFGNSINLLYGNNGSGKTNILEAVFILLLGRSQRGAPDSVMLKEGSDYYRLEGNLVFDEGRGEELSAACQKNGRKKLTVDGVGVKASELFARHTVVSLAPEDIDILSGPPSGRRNFLDIYLSQAQSQYLAVLGDYQKALAQKNAFLKQDNNTADTPYDDLLVEYGSDVILHRNEFINQVSPIASDFYGELSGGQMFTVSYKPSAVSIEDTEDTDTIKSAFKNKLARYRERERIMQMALVGSHRDDIEFGIGDYPARSYGSQGELRSAAVALKLAVFEYLKKVRRATPILLMDEIFAELDNDRRERLVGSFGGFGQLFLTSASAVPERLLANSRQFKIENGMVIDSD